MFLFLCSNGFDDIGNLEEDDKLMVIEKMKADHLKKLSKEIGLPVSGKKADVKERIRKHLIDQSNGCTSEVSPADHLETMNLEELQDTAKSRNLEALGSREELLDRIRKDIAFANGIIDTAPPGRDIQSILEELAATGGILANYIGKEKEEKIPKYVDVTINSIGLTPEKYTAGGTPSATADVIKKLAGDPFKDPPQYGSVSGILITNFGSFYDHLTNF